MFDLILFLFLLFGFMLTSVVIAKLAASLVNDIERKRNAKNRSRDSEQPGG